MARLSSRAGPWNVGCGDCESIAKDENQATKRGPTVIITQMPNPSMPADFPSAEFDAIAGLCDTLELAYRSRNNQQSSPNWIAFTSAMNGLTHRWAALAEADETFSEAFGKGDRRADETALFSFFTNALSALEITYFACYALIGQINPTKFNRIPASPRSVIPTVVVLTFEKAFPDELITTELRKTLDSKIYKQIKTRRDILSHRGSPPRQFGYAPPSLPGAIDIEFPSTVGWEGFELSKTFTENLRVELSKVLERLFEVMRAFCSQQVAKLLSEVATEN